MPTSKQRIHKQIVQERMKYIRKWLDEGLDNAEIYKRIAKVADGKYKVSERQIRRDIEALEKQRDNWYKSHNPHYKDIYQQKRQEAINELDELIRQAKRKKWLKVAGDLITKRARLEGVDKFVAPETKKKDPIEERYKGKSDAEVLEVLVDEFKDLASSLMRMAKGSKLNNINSIKIFIYRDIKGKTKKYRLTRYGEEVEFKA